MDIYLRHVSFTTACLDFEKGVWTWNIKNQTQSYGRSHMCRLAVSAVQLILPSHHNCQLPVTPPYSMEHTGDNNTLLQPAA